MLETRVQWSIFQVKLTGLLSHLVLSRVQHVRVSVPACDRLDHESNSRRQYHRYQMEDVFQVRRLHGTL